MKMNGILHVVDFKTEQIVAAIQPKDYWDDIRHWELKNNIDTLQFTTFDGTDQAITLQQQNLVLKQVRDGRIVPYVISNEVEKDSKDRSVTVHAAGAWVLLAKAGIIKPQKIESKTLDEFVDMALAGTKWKRGRTEYAGFHTMTIDEFIDPLTFLKKIASLFGLEIQYRVEVVGSQVVAWYVDMVKKRGRETGKEVMIGKDLVSVRRIEHSRDICTALVGFVRGEGDKLITVESINNGLPYITDSDAFQRWSENGQHKFGFYTPETEEQNMDPKRLMTLMETEFKKRVNTSVSYEVEAADISKVFGLSHEEISEGDMIRIKDTGFTPKLYLEARAIVGDESFTDPTQNKYTFGDYREIVDQNEELRKLYNKILGSLGSKANKELLEQLEKVVEESKKTIELARKESEAAKTLAEKVQQNLKNYQTTIIESVNPPKTGLEDGKTLWLDISNGKPGILKLWKNGTWEPVVPDVESVKQETLEQVNKDIESTKKELDKKVQAVQNEATGRYNEVKESLEGVSRTISNVKNEQGNINKKVTQIEQTADGFKQSIESLNKKDNEISNKLNTVKSTVEGTKQTIANIQSATDGLTKTTNEIKQTATSNTQKITQLQTNMNNIAVGSTNLASNSENGLNKQNMTGIWSDSKYMDLSDKINYRNKTFTVSFLFTGKMIKLNENPWFGVETSITYADGEQEWRSLRAEKQLKINVDYTDEPLSFTFKTKDKDITRIIFYYSGRNIDGNLNSHHAKFEEGNIRTTWQPATEEVTSKAEFTKKTTEIETSVNGIKENITKVENTQTSFDKRVTNVEKTADVIKQNVSKLQETQTQQGKAISEAQTTIKQHSNELALMVKMKDVEDYVGGIGSINLIRNAKLTNSVKYWKLHDATRTHIDTTVVKDGINSFKTVSTGNTSNHYYGAEQTVELREGETIVASAYFRTDNPAGLDQGGALEIKFLNSSGGVIKQVSEELKLTKDQWLRVYKSATAPSGTVKVIFRYQIRRNGTLWMAQPMLQVGTIPSSFLENPNDFVDKDKIMDDLADKVATEQYNKKVTELERKISANEKGVEIISEKHETFLNDTFDAYVKEVGSKLQVLDEGILAQVKKGNIIAAINLSAEKLKIKVDLIDLVGKVKAEWITAGLLQGTTVKTSNTNEHIHMKNQVLQFVNQGRAKIVIGFENEKQSKTSNPYIVIGEGDGTGRNLGSIYKDAKGVYYRFIDKNGAESNMRMTERGDLGLTAQSSMWLKSAGILNLDGDHVTIHHNDYEIAEFRTPTYGNDCDIILGNHIIRSSKVSGYDKLLQIKNRAGNEFRGIEVSEVTAHGGVRSETNLWAEQNSYAMQHINRSTEKIKTSIHDLPFSPLEKVRELKVKQYFLKRDMYELYQMRMNKPEDRIEPYTIADVETQYGFIAEETDDIFTTPEKDGIKLYSTLSILTAAVQELEMKYNEKIQMMEEQHKVEMAEMNRRIEVLEQLLVDKLIDKKAEQQ
ncbi:tail fiber domain-containing protein [Bacillus cytotoxicus]|uniref:phage tail spike protein n=5 Tax=Bacillus cereus group TaxID=86661 RepID=UPI001AEE9719|nr:phage tail spike protein [Bacillus cytotoxicus]QTR81850.1 tail fiber domain-containing protein [Bacillus cytotoxicus]QTR85587.1 tail fiber domain-containing protein [Bacillus cytotoxicus]